MHTSGPVRILFTIPNLDTAGSGWVLMNIIDHLDRDRFDPTVCVSRRGGALEQHYADRKIPIVEHAVRVSTSPRRTLLRRARAAAAPLRAEGYDLWHSFDYRDDYTEPLVARLGGARAWVYIKKSTGWNHRSWWARSLLATRIAATNTDMMHDFFGNVLFRRRAALVHPGLPVDDWHLDHEAGQAFRTSLGIADGTPVVACVANVGGRKGQRDLARALEHLPMAHVLAAGRIDMEDYASAIRSDLERIGASDRFHWLGYSGDVRTVLAAADVFCLPTVLDWMFEDKQGRGGEGCPIALLEAMAAGVPCVATDIPGSRDLVVDGVTGYLAAPHDPRSLATAIDRLIADPARRRDLGAAGRRRAEQAFSAEREASEYMGLYDDAMRHALVGRLGRRRG